MPKGGHKGGGTKNSQHGTGGHHSQKPKGSYGGLPKNFGYGTPKPPKGGKK